MSTVASVRLNEEEQEILTGFADMQGMKLTTFLKAAAMSVVEDFFDIRAADEALAEYEKTGIAYSHEEVMEMLADETQN